MSDEIAALQVLELHLIPQRAKPAMQKIELAESVRKLRRDRRPTNFRCRPLPAVSLDKHRFVSDISVMSRPDCRRREAIMPTDVLEFYALPERERRRGQASLAVLDRAGARDQVEFSVVRPDGTRDSVRIPKAAVAVIRDVLAKLVDSERVAVLREDEELSPEQAATILGISRPLVVRRMDSGRLPFRYVGAHRRCRLSNVLKLRREEEGQREALDRLASDTEDLMRDHGL
jgi:excisionase family DNA binding protein